jgi:branched-chain amino acid transport system permease protein
MHAPSAAEVQSICRVECGAASGDGTATAGYALVAVGYSLIYRTTGVVNFAQGSYVMIGGFATWWFFAEAGLPYLLAIAGGIAVATLVGLALWLVVVLPLWRRRSPPYVVLLSTIVFGAVVGNATLLLLGTLPQTLPPWLAARAGHGPAG